MESFYHLTELEKLPQRYQSTHEKFQFRGLGRGCKYFHFMAENEVLWNNENQIILKIYGCVTFSPPRTSSRTVVRTYG